MKSLGVVREVRPRTLCRAPGVRLAHRSRLRVGVDAACVGSTHRDRRLESAGLGATHRQDSTGSTVAEREPTSEHRWSSTGAHPSKTRRLPNVEALDVVAAETGKTVPQVAINWLLQRPISRDRHHRRPQRGAIEAESRRRGLESDAGRWPRLDAASVTTLPYPPRLWPAGLENPPLRSCGTRASWRRDPACRGAGNCGSVAQAGRSPSAGSVAPAAAPESAIFRRPQHHRIVRRFMYSPRRPGLCPRVADRRDLETLRACGCRPNVRQMRPIMV